MELKDEIALICVNAILQLKLGIVPDVYAAQQQPRWPQSQSSR